MIAARVGWQAAYIACALFAIPAMVVGLTLGEPARHRAAVDAQRCRAQSFDSIVAPLVEFFRRRGALLVLLFVLLHKIGDTLANLTFRLLFNDLQYTNDEIAVYDVGFGFWAYLAGIFIGGMLYTRLGMKRSVLLSLRAHGRLQPELRGARCARVIRTGQWRRAIGFENFASGIGGVTVVAYFSALCDLRYTAAQYALISAAASIVGRLLTGTSAGALIEMLGYVNFYVLTTVLAFPAIILFWMMMRSGLVDASVGTAATSGAESSTDRAAPATPSSRKLPSDRDS